MLRRWLDTLIIIWEYDWIPRVTYMISFSSSIQLPQNSEHLTSTTQKLVFSTCLEVKQNKQHWFEKFLKVFPEDFTLRILTPQKWALLRTYTPLYGIRLKNPSIGGSNKTVPGSCNSCSLRWRSFNFARSECLKLGRSEPPPKLAPHVRSVRNGLPGYPWEDSFQAWRGRFPSWRFQPVWKIWSSNWIISPSRVENENKKYLKPPPSSRI